MNKLSVFDLDRTLVSKNISFSFGAFLFRRRKLSLWPAIRSIWSYTRFKYLQPSIQRIHQSILARFLKGLPIDDLKQEVQLFFDESLQEMLYPPALTELRQAQAQGNHLLLLSAAPDFLVEPVAERLGITDWEATRYLVDKRERLSKIGGFMSGERKAEHTLKRVDEFALARDAVDAFSDSIVDLPLLEVAGRPVGVCPDRKLAIICSQRGWEVI